MSAYNSESEQCVNIIELNFKEVAKLPPSYLLDGGKKFIKRLITVLIDMPHPINETDGVAYILLLDHQGAYDDKFPKAEEYIDRYKDQSAGAIEFAYNTDMAAAGTEMGIRKGIVDLFRRLLPSNC